MFPLFSWLVAPQVNRLLSRDVERLEAERVEMKQRLVMQALDRGERAVDLGLSAGVLGCASYCLSICASVYTSLYLCPFICLYLSIPFSPLSNF